jgi:outer membrane protein OmpA-like peptidoglycan-associated protein
VADALQARGVDPSSVTVEARGELAPAVGTGDGVAEQLNRRVVISW